MHWPWTLIKSLVERIKEKIDYVRSMPGNEKCCDCDADGPEWASINLGILLCLNCGGAHRFVHSFFFFVSSFHRLSMNHFPGVSASVYQKFDHYIWTRGIWKLWWSCRIWEINWSMKFMKQRFQMELINRQQIPMRMNIFSMSTDEEKNRCRSICLVWHVVHLLKRNMYKNHFWKPYQQQVRWVLYRYVQSNVAP